MEIQQKLLTINQYSRPGTAIGTIKKITIHWVGNAGSKAINNRNYFESLKEGKKNAYGNYIYASSHYIVGLEGEIIQCVPENEVAYHGNSHNSFAIGIECCHPDWGGKFAEDTCKSLIELCADICRRYKLKPAEALERHYDITGKDCPHYYISHTDAWNKFIKDVEGAMGDDEVVKKIDVVINGNEKQVNAIEKDGTNYVKLRDLQDDKIIVGYSNGKPTIEIKG